MTKKLKSAYKKKLDELLDRNIFIDLELKKQIVKSNPKKQKEILSELEKMDGRQTEMFGMFIEKMGIDKVDKFFKEALKERDK